MGANHPIFVMKRVELKLIPAPGAKPEFLAQAETVNAESNHAITQTWSTLPNEIVLEGYTRDPWAADTATSWISIQVKSVDGRKKLPGFVDYLRQRKKSAFGRVQSSNNGVKDTLLWIVSFKQASSQTLMCRVAPLSKIPNCPLKPFVSSSGSSATTKNPQSNPSSSKPAPAAAAPATKRKKGFGLLGNLVGAQRRTNQQVETASAKPASNSAASGAGADATGASDAAAAGGGPPAVEYKTAGQCLADFRQTMEQKMLDFDIDSDPVLKVKIDLAELLRTVEPSERQTGRVTMEILKFVVYEQAEEVNEEWIAHKEPSEFMDEAVIAIYKEGEAPPEVLEEINKGELPDEVRGQQRALSEQLSKQQQQKASKNDVALQRQALARGNADDDEDDDIAALNVVKRDRRTIEEIQREQIQGDSAAKRARME